MKTMEKCKSTSYHDKKERGREYIHKKDWKRKMSLHTNLSSEANGSSKDDFQPSSSHTYSTSGKDALKHQARVERPYKFQKMSKEDRNEGVFNWKDYQSRLNTLFFSVDDFIQRETDDYNDFWKFFYKYQSFSSERRSLENKASLSFKTNESSESKIYKLPLVFNKLHCVNFTLKGKEHHQLQDKLPPIDHDDENAKRLSPIKISEFKMVLLFYLDFTQKQKFNNLRKIREAQKNLPIAEYKKDILKIVEHNTVTILAGDTGCGKSTQVPQYLIAAGYQNIACTQPRRIACVSLCKRVAYETLNQYGSAVGFQIRFEKRKTEHTKILFVTEGLLLKQVTLDPLLAQYDVIVIDEIHERHLQTDFLLGIIKCLIIQRPEIKVILMSATINIELFSNYFMGKAPVIQIPGRLFPIELKYFPISMVEKSKKNERINPAPYVRILNLIDSSYPSKERGDLLIFLSGMREIVIVMEATKLYAQQSNRWVILPLHSTLSVSEQEKVFDIPPDGVRKCILSTNIAETSVTIDGVRFVADSGKVKEISFDPVHKMQKLKEFWISQASGEQRKGRAGRTGPGVCFRLYSEAEYASFEPYNKPEIMRVSLDNVVLEMLSMGLPSIKLFPFIEPPPIDSLETSVLSLKSHSALTSDETLTSIGQLLAQLPLDVSLGKMLIMGSLFHRLGPVLSLAAAMSVQSPFTNRAMRDPDCIALNNDLQSDQGDAFTLLFAYREWLYMKAKGEERGSGGTGSSRRWCQKRGLEEQRFYEMTKLRQQFMQMLRDNGIHELAEKDASAASSSERAKRYGELYQLKHLKRELHKQDSKKTQILRVDNEGGAWRDGEDERDVGLEINDVDFKIRYDDSKLKELYRDSKTDSFKDTILLKVILCSGLYPNIAIADEHNNYKSGSEQLFHTSTKPFVVLHPNSVFASKPEVLQLTQPDFVVMQGFSEKNPCSSRHQILAFVSLLETNKPYLVNSLRLPAAQSLLLFANNIDTNADMSIIVCDNFIELKFAVCVGAQNLLFQAVSLRTKWKTLLEQRIKASKATISNKDKADSLSIHLKKEICSSLVDFFQNEQYYSIRRLLAADVKVLHYGPGPGVEALYGNPFSEEEHPCLLHPTKGGVILNDYLTYNSLVDVYSTVTAITAQDSVCPLCDGELHATTLERLRHMKLCADDVLNRQKKSSEEERSDPNQKEYWCDLCEKKFWFSLKDILKHKKTHNN